MIDFHTHILPGIDDGSRSSEESLSKLEEANFLVFGLLEASPKMKNIT